jgi:hypothetical protein
MNLSLAKKKKKCQPENSSIAHAAEYVLATDVSYTTCRSNVSPYMRSTPHPLSAGVAAAGLRLLFGILNLVLERMDVRRTPSQGTIVD